MDKRSKKAYQSYVERITPKHSCWLNCCKAFIVGGALCVLGQGLTQIFLNMGMAYSIASAYTTLCLIALSALLTGLNLVVPIVKFGGAGYLVPITGFANAVAACAIEFRQEGWIFGLGSKAFNIAGPVILYGTVVSSLFGLLYYILIEISVI